MHALKAIRAELIDPKIAEHRGRIVKTTGDGMLVEFASVVDAVRCAVEVQRGMAERNTGVEPAAERIEFRIGINLGDIIIDGDDIFGDGVNIAARLEALAEPGGICVSGTVHDHVRDKLDVEFDDLGEQQVKNIARPVHVYPRWRRRRSRRRQTPIAAARQAVDRGAAVPEHERRPGAGIFRRRHGRGHHHRDLPRCRGCSSSRAIRASPTRARRST